ncbi:MAG: lipopolysaccharide biosynthesis protein [Spirochaetes bacterium]|nr:hypothetical protein [Syntrophaceae bacterium]MBN2771539.1 lipopolysaccharide biosynthesis protein [Spirochaetota bacterium]
MENQPVKERDTYDEDEIDLLDLLAVMLRRKRLIIWLTVFSAVGILLFAVVSLLLAPEVSYLPNVYTPKATMLIQNDNSGGLGSALSSSGLGDLASLAGVSTGGQNYGTLAIYLTGMNSYLDAVIEKFDLVERYKIEKYKKADTRKALKENLSSSFDEETGILTISFEDIDPVFATEVVNYAVELLDKRFTVIGGNRNQTRKTQLEEKLADVTIEMRRLEEDIQAFQKEYGVISVESLATEQITTVAQVRSQLIMKEMEIKTYASLSSIEDPMLRRLRTERNNLLQLLTELEEGFSEYESILPSQRDLPKIALEFAHLKRDLMVQEAIYKLLIQQYEATKLSLSGEEPVFQILEVAEVPDKKSGPSRGMLCIVVTMAGFFLSILLAFIKEAIANVKKDPEQMIKLKNAWKGK